MEIDIMNINKFIKENDIKEVTSSSIFIGGSTSPDPEGLGSYEIFGKPGSYERKHNFAYIDLGDIFIHPHIFNMLVSLRKIIKSVTYGPENYYIKNGMYKVVEEGAKVSGPVGFGTKFIYDTWEQLDFYKNTESNIVKDKINLLSNLKKDEIFINKFLVIPAFYRDIDTFSGKKNEINIIYQRMISLATTIKTSSSMFYTSEFSDAHRKMMDSLTEIYTYFVNFTTGTKGFIHKNVMGKSTDFAARMVISTPLITAENEKDMEVSFSHSAIPLSAVLKCFAPFIVYEFKRYINDRLQGSNYVYKYVKGELIRLKLADHYTEELLSENIYKLIDLYYESKEHRLDYFTLLGEDDIRIPVVYITLEHEIITATDSNIKEFKIKRNIRPITMTELFYIVAMNIVSDKYIYITRYPIEDYHNIYPSKMNIIPYYKYKREVIDNIMYPRFPVIDRDNDLKNVENVFIDTLRLFPTYLSALGADYDGDQVSVQGIFGNNEADEYIFSKRNIINIAGKTVRTTSTITEHTLFALTRRVENI